MHRLWYDLRSQSMFEEAARGGDAIDDTLEDMIWRMVERLRRAGRDVGAGNVRGRDLRHARRTLPAGFARSPERTPGRARNAAASSMWTHARSAVGLVHDVEGDLDRRAPGCRCPVARSGEHRRDHSCLGRCPLDRRRHAAVCHLGPGLGIADPRRRRAAATQTRVADVGIGGGRSRPGLPAPGVGGGNLGRPHAGRWISPVGGAAHGGRPCGRRLGHDPRLVGSAWRLGRPGSAEPGADFGCEPARRRRRRRSSTRTARRSCPA